MIEGKEIIPHSRPWVTANEVNGVTAATARGLLEGRFYAEEFQSRLNRWTGGSVSGTTRSGSEALAAVLALLAGEGRREVILPTYICREVWDSVMRVGFEPILADVTTSGLLDTAAVDSMLGPDTRAVVGVDLFGRPMNFPALSDLVVNRGLRTCIIRDACHTVRSHSGPNLSPLVSATFYSFGATKPWTAAGAGGAYVLHSEELLHKHEAHNQNLDGSGSFPLSGLECSFGIAQLARYDDFIARRAYIRHVYDEASSGLLCHDKDTSPDLDLFRYTFLAPQGFDFAESWFGERGITVRRGVDALLHQVFPRAGEGRHFPEAERLFRHQVSVPFYPALDGNSIDRVAHALSEYPR